MPAESTSISRSAAENPLKGKVLCGHCGGKMQRKRGSGGASWHFFTCITQNRIGKEFCDGNYIREEAVMAGIEANAIEKIEQVVVHPSGRMEVI